MATIRQGRREAGSYFRRYVKEELWQQRLFAAIDIFSRLCYCLPRIFLPHLRGDNPLHREKSMLKTVSALLVAGVLSAAAYGTANAAPIAPLPTAVKADTGVVTDVRWCHCHHYWRHHYYWRRHYYWGGYPYYWGGWGPWGYGGGGWWGWGGGWGGGPWGWHHRWWW
jgi:hypothetical protein